MRTRAGRASAIGLALVAAVIAAALPDLAHAQALTSSPSGIPLAPSGNAAIAVPGDTLTQPQPPIPAAPGQLPAQIAPGAPVPLYLNARFGRDLPAIGNGLIWRIYGDKPDAAGAFRLLKEEKVPAPTFVLPPGGYVIHVSLGHASAAKQVMLRSDTVRETFDIAAGGIRIEGRVGDVKIPSGQISFDVFKGSQFEPGDKRPLAQGVVTGDITLVPEGIYTVVSNYGDGNAVVRSDVRVQVGRLTDVTVTHRAAVITLKLVAPGGDALANTAWSVLTPGGDVIKESIGAFPRVILAEGEYRAIARNEGKVYERDFKVVTGVDTEIAVVAR
jgi:hypothetical protein